MARKPLPQSQATANARVQAPPPVPSTAEVVQVRTRRVSCEGVGGALGHPRVYLEMGEADEVECPYCDRRFVLARNPADESELLAPGAYEGPAGH